MSNDKITGWQDVPFVMPSNTRMVWVGIKDSRFGPIVIEARYYSCSDSWTVGDNETEIGLRQAVYCWHEIIVPELPEWMFEKDKKDEQR